MSINLHNSILIPFFVAKNLANTARSLKLKKQSCEKLLLLRTQICWHPNPFVVSANDPVQLHPIGGLFVPSLDSKTDRWKVQRKPYKNLVHTDHKISKGSLWLFSIILILILMSDYPSVYIIKSSFSQRLTLETFR